MKPTCPQCRRNWFVQTTFIVGRFYCTACNLFFSKDDNG